ncbi:MAG: chloride channel protein [Candidatus Magnetomorum sp.]|nr:chloride channel protein [Candidatus Magnetomorum sp.]
MILKNNLRKQTLLNRICAFFSHFFQQDDRLLLIAIASFVGIFSGLAALLLNNALLGLEHFLHEYRIYWWAFILPACGAALSSLFLNKVLKEGAGHGVPEVIYAVSRYGGLLRMRSAFSRIISSCLTIGSGGSAGPEAPVVMSGASIGSNIAKYFGLNDRQRVTIVGCGSAGAIASIFNAPIAGIVFTIEVILGEWSAINIVPIAVAAVSGTEVSRLLKGNQIPFQHRQFSIDLPDILSCIGLALLCFLVSILLTRGLRQMHRMVHHVHLPLWIRAAIGGSLVGLLGMILPDIMGEGYQAIRQMIEGNYSAGLLFALILVLSKILATTLTLGWGGSGGIFAPCLVIGSMTGLMYHRLITLVCPQVSWVNEGCFSLLGMAGLISGILQAPLTGIFLIVEITGGYEVIVPLILTSVLSSTLCQFIEPASFYLKELVEQGQLLRPGTDKRVLSDLTLKEIIDVHHTCVHQDMMLRQFVEVIKKTRYHYYPVVDKKTRRFEGIIYPLEIRPHLFNIPLYDAVIVAQIMRTNIPTATLNEDLNDVLKRMDRHQLSEIPIVSNARFIGMVSKETLLNRYRQELIVQTSG